MAVGILQVVSEPNPNKCETHSVEDNATSMKILFMHVHIMAAIDFINVHTLVLINETSGFKLSKLLYQCILQSRPYKRNKRFSKTFIYVHTLVKSMKILFMYILWMFKPMSSDCITTFHSCQGSC